MAKGAIVNTKTSLLLLEDKMKISRPIKKETITFLNEESNNKGLLERVRNMEIRKNKATVK